MKNFIYDIFDRISKCYKYNRCNCRLLEINLSEQEVKFQIKMKLPILRCTISQAIHELNLVSHISSIEACYLGGYYGIMLGESKDAKNGVSFLLKNKTGRCQIQYEDRYGNILDRRIFTARNCILYQ